MGKVTSMAASAVLPGFPANRSQKLLCAALQLLTHTCLWLAQSVFTDFPAKLQHNSLQQAEINLLLLCRSLRKLSNHRTFARVH